MRLDSVMTVIGLGHHDRYHLLLCACQGRVRKRRSLVKLNHALEGGGTLTLDFENVEDPPGAPARALVDAGEQAVRLIFVNYPDPGHQLSTVTVQCFSTR